MYIYTYTYTYTYTYIHISIYIGSVLPGFPPSFLSQIRVSDVTFVTFSVTNNVRRHICHISWKNVTLSHTKTFFVTGEFFWSHPSRKTSHFGPAGTKFF